MRKKFLSLLVVASLSFSLSASVFAAESTPEPVAQYSLESVVPSDYFKEYEGKYQTFDQVYDAFQQDVRPMTDAEQSQGEYAFSVQTPDELAALLAYMKDQRQLAESQVQTVYVDNEKTALSATAAAATDIDTVTIENTIYDNYVYWIKGYVALDYVPSSGKITKTTAWSSLLGVTMGHTWKPVEPRITVVSDIKRNVLFAGVITTNIWVGGVGEVLQDPVNYTMGVQSIPTIE